MRVGLIARATATGLGTQTQNFYRGYEPDSVLLLRDGSRWWQDDLSWYPDAHVARFDGTDIEPGPAEAFASEIDVLFSVETLYSWKFAAMLKNRHIRTVVQGNPEFYRRPGEKGAAPIPDQWTWPTTWLLSELPEGPVVPVPAFTEPRPPKPQTKDSDLLTFLHVAGHRANGDRNGTEVFCKAIRHLQQPCRVKVIGQDGRLPIPDVIPNHVKLDVNANGTDDRWDLYRHADVLVSPRRYGGLSLPVQEAMHCGLVVMMSDCSPNRDWPIIPIPCSVGTALRTPFGHVRTFEVRARTLASEMDALTQNRPRIHSAREDGEEWLVSHSWERLRPDYDKVLAG
jgi:hypothetical protein